MQTRQVVGLPGESVGHGSMFAMRLYPVSSWRPRAVRTAVVLPAVAALLASAGCSTLVGGTAVLAEPKLGQPVVWGACRPAGGGGAAVLRLPGSRGLLAGRQRHNLAALTQRLPSRVCRAAQTRLAAAQKPTNACEAVAVVAALAGAAVVAGRVGARGVNAALGPGA